MQVLFVNSPTLQTGCVSRSMAGGLGFDGNEAMILPPLDLAYLAAGARQGGHTVSIIDGDAIGGDTERVLVQATRFGPDAVIATLSLPSIAKDIEFIKKLGKRTGAVLYIRTMVRYEPLLEEMLIQTGAKAVIHGECDLSICEILAGKESVAGTAWLEGCEVISLNPDPIVDLDSLPIPARDLLDNSFYRYPLLGKPTATIQSSRGCPFPCRYYCPYPLVEGTKWRGRSAENVFRELKEIVEVHKVSNILFRDATFTMDKERTAAICDLIIDNNLRLKWWCETRVDRLDEDLLAKMARAGCAGINIGVETGDQAVMSSQAKRGLTLESLKNIRNAARRVGIALHFLLIAGLPEETRQSIVDTYDLILDLAPESLGITLVTPYPGTPLWHDATENGWVETMDWARYGGHSPVMHSSNLTSEDMVKALEFLHLAHRISQLRAGEPDSKVQAAADEAYLRLLSWAAEDKAEKALRDAGLLADCVDGLAVSVIVPTKDRSAVLTECLAALSAQIISKDSYEVIVVDDGSEDDTPTVCLQFESRLNMTYIRQEPAGPGAARNAGIQAAKGRLILMIGDDIIGEPDLLSQHLLAHKARAGRKIAVLGHIAWPKDVKVTPFMEHITGAGAQQFGFSLIKDRENAGFQFFYTSNISVPRDLLLSLPYLFDMDFRYAAYEDTELSYRLHKLGMQVVYHPAARVYHRHPTSYQSFWERQRKAGRSAVVFANKHPELDDTILCTRQVTNGSWRPDPERRKTINEAVAELEKLDFDKLMPIGYENQSLESIIRSTLLQLATAGLQDAYSQGIADELAEANALPPSPANPLAGFDVSIIIPVFNNVEYTKQCIEWLVEKTGDNISYELIIVDNASTDETPAFLAQLEGDVTIIRNDENLGFAKACNQGAAAARGKYLVFLNNDTAPQDGWLDALIAEAESHPDVHIAGSRLLYPDATIQHAGVAVAIATNGHIMPFHMFRGRDMVFEPAVERRELQVVTGACMLIRPEAFRRAGGFDEAYRNGYEDVDLCFRVREQGGKVVYCPDSVVVHYESVSPGRFEANQENDDLLQRRWQGKITEDARAIASSLGMALGMTKFGPDLVEVEPAPAVLTSIVILTHNQLEYTKSCVKSIREYTNEPYELIFVDNGSSDGTVHYLRSLKDVTVIRNKKNLGYAKGCNQGIAAAKGDYILLLNNDTVVTPGWLERLLAPFTADHSIGITGPRSNYVVGAQKLDSVDYDQNSLAGLNEFAEKLAGENCSQGFFVPRIIGLCMCVKREVIEKIGGFDERFKTGNLEDDDFSVRAQLAGFRLCVVSDSFVHHFGNRTFIGAKIDYRKSIADNYARFRKKYAIPVEFGPEAGWPTEIVLSRAFDPGVHFEPLPGQVRPKTSKMEAKSVGPTLGLCMIVKNEAHCIGRCLESVAGFVDEMIVVDTGSMDETCQVARSYGATVIDHPWRNDFSDALNAAIENSTTDWILRLDADEALDESSREEITRLIQTKEPVGFRLREISYVTRCGQPEIAEHMNARLFPNNPDIRYTGSIHEQLAFRGAPQAMKLIPCTAVIHHYGYQDPEREKLKQERNIELLRRAIAGDPGEPANYYNLGVSLFIVGEVDEALANLQKCTAICEEMLEKKGIYPIFALNAFAAKGMIFLQLKKYAECVEVAKECARLDATYPDVHFNSALALKELGRKDEAKRELEAALSAAGAVVIASSDAGCRGWKSHRLLAEILADDGQYEEAAGHFEEVLKEKPGTIDNLLALGRIYSKLGDAEKSESLLRAAVAAEPVLVTPRIALAETLETHGKPNEALDVLWEGIEASGSLPALVLAMADILLGVGRFEEALSAYDAVLAVGSLSTDHLLAKAECLRQLRRYDEAGALLEDIIRANPNFASGYEAIGDLFAQLGAVEDALGQYSKALQSNDPPASAAVKIGHLLLEIGSYADAEQAFMLALGIEPENEDAKVGLSSLDEMLKAAK